MRGVVLAKADLSKTMFISSDLRDINLENSNINDLRIFSQKIADIKKHKYGGTFNFNSSVTIGKESPSLDSWLARYKLSDTLPTENVSIRLDRIFKIQARDSITIDSIKNQVRDSILVIRANNQVDSLWIQKLSKLEKQAPKGMKQLKKDYFIYDKKYLDENGKPFFLLMKKE